MRTPKSSGQGPRLSAAHTHNIHGFSNLQHARTHVTNKCIHAHTHRWQCHAIDDDDDNDDSGCCYCANYYYYAQHMGADIYTRVCYYTRAECCDRRRSGRVCRVVVRSPNKVVYPECVCVCVCLRNVRACISNFSDALAERKFLMTYCWSISWCCETCVSFIKITLARSQLPFATGGWLSGLG